MLTEYLPRSGEKIADCLIKRNGLLNQKWSYDYGVVWCGMEALYALTGDETYFAYIRDALDTMVDAAGNIAGYSRDAYNLDDLCNGRQLIYLYQQTSEEKYRKAAALLRSQLDAQPRTTDGGFWHKQVYPHFVGQMKNGEIFVAKCCQGAGLGGSTGRDGSFDYYISENVISHDLKAEGAFIQAACEEQHYTTL